jgi:HEAT repeat protein
VLDDLRDANPKVRRNAARLLAGNPTRKAVPALAKALDDPDPSVAEWAARALGAAGPKARSAVPRLTRCLTNPPGEGVREAAVAALGRIGPGAQRAVPQLIKLLDRKQTPRRTRAAAATALGEMGPIAKAAVPALTKALRDPGVGPAAVAALIRMGPAAKPAVPALKRKMRPEKPYWLDIVRFLADIDPAVARAAVPDLRAFAASEPVRDRGIVEFRNSQQKIAEAKRLLKKLESSQKAAKP